jgi:thermitase
MEFTGRLPLRHSLLLVVSCLLIFALMGSFLFPGPVVADDPEPIDTNEVIVQWKPNRSHLVPTTVDDREQSTIPNVEVLEFSSEAEAAAALTKLERNPNVVYAEPNKKTVRPLVIPNDPQYGNQWSLLKTHTDIAWDVEQGLSSVTIAFVDTGVNGLHEDLNGKVLAGKSFVGSLEVDLLADTDSDNCNHGTGVASVATAKTNNSKGVAGVAWEPKILPVKVIDLPSPCAGDIADLAEGIRYAADAGAKIINISLGLTDDSLTVYNAVVYAQGKGALVIAAAGNDGINKVNYPAAYPKVIAVGATDQNDSKASFSNSGVDLDIVAPGVSLTNASALGITAYQSSSGTSVATPLVSGLAALLLSRNPAMTAQDSYDAIVNSADKVSGMSGNTWTVGYGWGRLNARAALEQFRDYHAKYVSQNAYPTIERGASAFFSVTFRNNGKTTWKQSDPLYPVHLGTSRGQDRIPGWVRGGGWIGPNRIEMIDGTVTPGSNGTFNFWMSAPQDKEFGTFREYFQPVADFSNWMEDWGVYWDVTVPTEAEKYKYDYISQNFNEKSVKRGDAVEFTLTLKNTGQSTWVRNTVNLGTDRPQDRIPGWIRGGGSPSGWLKENRVEMVEATISPGANGSFKFYMTVPGDKAFGIYREYFRPVADGITWMEDRGIYWELVVTE